MIVRLCEDPRDEVIDLLADQVEIGRYGPRLAAQVELAAAGEAACRLQLLFAYIAGANRPPMSESDTSP